MVEEVVLGIYLDVEGDGCCSGGRLAPWRMSNGSMIDEGKLRMILGRWWDAFSGMPSLVFYDRDEAGSRYGSGDFLSRMALVWRGFLVSFILLHL